MRPTRFTGALCACLLGLSPTARSAPADATGVAVRPVVVRVVREEAEVFTSVSGASRSLGQVFRGQQYVLLRQDGADGERVRIRYSDRDGWIDRTALERHDQAEVNVVLVLPYLIVRSAPGGAPLGKLDNGHYVAPILTQGEWKKINYAGKEGWIQAKHLGLPDRDHFAPPTLASSVPPAQQPVSQQPASQQPASQPASQQNPNGGGTPTNNGGTPTNNGGGTPTNNGGGAPTNNGGGATEPLAQPDPVGNPDTSGLGRPSQRGFLQLPASGTGFAAYSSPGRRWGTQKMIYGIMRVGMQWATLPRTQGRATRSPVLGIGDISFPNGGRMDGHVSHQKGVDVDVRLARNDGRNAPTNMRPGSATRGAYSRQFTAEAVNLFSQIPSTLILLNDRDVPRTTWDRKGNHYDHFRVRIPEGR